MLYLKKYLKGSIMRKLLLSSIVAITCYSTTIHAADPSLYPQSISILGGYTIFSQESKLDNNHAYSFRFTDNNFGIDNFGISALQIALDYTPGVPYKGSEETTSSIKLGPNLLWYMQNSSEFTPYLLLGAGLEHISNPIGYNTIDLYANGGVGVEYQLRNDIALVGEAKYTYSEPTRKGTTASMGLKFSFGE